MKITAGYANIANQHVSSAVAIGIFDGVHLGHQRLLDLTRQQAREEELLPVVYTFDPHPIAVLAPERAPTLVQSIEQRLAMFERLGFAEVVVEPFSRAFASLEPETFIRRILIEGLHAKHVFVGEGFCFGQKQAGNLRVLREVGAREGFSAHGVPHVLQQGTKISSTAIRERIAAGDMRGAHSLLGRPFTVCGSVVHGAGRGRGLGFATANLNVGRTMTPASGVYAAWARVQDLPRPAIINVGYAPTFSGGSLQIEAHLLDYDGPALYGEDICLAFIERIRSEQRFESPDALVRQIEADVNVARRMHAQTSAPEVFL